ncbi:MAG: NADH-quinone oxidoreductase subunit NuoH [Armatimonadetes bacterium]|nr:NADH-quinone oxidoreductase subunit NuoH [Armatimonadota bacterium]
MSDLAQWLQLLRRYADAMAGRWHIPLLANDFLAWLGAGIFLLALITIVSLVAIYLERKVSGYIQSRLGPVRAGPIGIFQTILDALKLLQKEDIVPAAADWRLHLLGPVIFMTATLMMFAVIPWDRGINVARWLDLEIGLLYLVAVSGIGVIGIVAGGWGSNNKWSLLGALRGAAQLISYEIPFLLAALCVVLLAGTLSLSDIVERQQAFVTEWYIWRPILWLAVAIFLIAGVAEVNRVPFDIPEAESELVAGFHTEYTGMKFALYFLGEYGHLYVLGLLFSVLFLGGWASPLGGSNLPFEGFIWLNLKAWAFVLAAMWIRWTLPRLRVDQLMELAWKLLIPAGFVALLVVSVALIGT